MTTFAEIQSLVSGGATSLDLTDNRTYLSLSEAQALVEAGVSFDASDKVIIRTSAANIEALSPAEIASFDALGATSLLATDRALELDLAQLNALAEADIATGTQYSPITAATPSDVTLRAIAPYDGAIITALAGGGYVVTYRAGVSGTNSAGIFSQVFDATGAAVGDDSTLVEDLIMSPNGWSTLALPDGGFLVMFNHDTQVNYESQFEIYRFNATGEPVGQPLTIDAAMIDTFAAAMLADGSYILTWKSYTGSVLSTHAMLVDTAGNAGDPIQLGQSTAYQNQSPASIVQLANGNIVVVWSEYMGDGDNAGLLAQVLDSSGQPVGDTFIVNTIIAGDQTEPVTVALDDGRFMVIWQSGYSLEIQARIFNQNGAADGPEFTVNDHTASYQLNPDVAILDNGKFVVTWQSVGPDINGYGVSYQIFNADGSKLGNETVANLVTTGNQTNPQIVALSDGGFVIVWEDTSESGDGREINAQIFDADGNRVGSPLEINNLESGEQDYQKVTALADGGFAVIWTTTGNGILSTRVFAHATEKVIFSDTAEHLSALTLSDVANLASLDVSSIRVSDSGSVSFGAAVAEGLADIAGLKIYGAGSVTVKDTGSAIADLDAADIAAIHTFGITGLDATDNKVTLTLAQATAYATTFLQFDWQDAVRIAIDDTSLLALSRGELADLFRTGADIFDLADDTLSLTVAQFFDITNIGFRFAAGDTITIVDSQMNLGELDPIDIAALGTFGASSIDLNDLYDPATLSFAQAQAFVDAGLKFADDDRVRIQGAGSEVAALTANEIAAFANIGVDEIVASLPVGITLAQHFALLENGVALNAGIEDVTLVDTPGNIMALTPAQIADLAENDIRKIDSIGDAIGLTNDQILALQSAYMSIDSDQQLLLKVTGAELAEFSTSELVNARDYGVSLIATDDGNLDATLATLGRVGDSGLSFFSGFDVRLADSYETLMALTPPDKGILTALGVDVFRLVDTVTKISGLTVTEIAALGTQGVTQMHATNGPVSISMLQAQTFSANGLSFDRADLVTVTGSSSTFGDPDTVDVPALTGVGIDRIDLTDDVATFSLAQIYTYSNAGIGFVQGDDITVRLTHTQAVTYDSGTDSIMRSAGVDVIEASMTATQVRSLTVSDIATLGAAGLDRIDVTTDSVLISKAQSLAFDNAGIAFADGDAVTVHKVPKLVADTMTASEATVALVPVLANDTVFDGLTLSVTSATVSSGSGKVTINRDGSLSVRYTGPDIDGNQTARVKVTYTAYDSMEGATGSLTVTFKAVTEDVIGTARGETLTGGAFGELIKGLGGNDILMGLGGADEIHGGAGNDRLIGGAGADHLFGESGNDTFVFASLSDLGKAAATSDVIEDFKRGDIIGLAAIDANGLRGGNQAFSFIGTDHFHKAAGELRYASVGSELRVMGDVNGDGKADFVLTVDGIDKLARSDFLL